jgi:selenide, water dikinase
VHPDRIVHKTGARLGDDLILTKPLGSGVISTAIKESKARPEWVEEAVESMTTLNAPAAEAMLDVGVDAATDVTGFGLMGHLLQMLDDKVGAEIDFTALPFYSGAIELADADVIPGGSRRNYEAARERVDAGVLEGGRLAILFDAQTSGGLLLAVDQSKSGDLLEALDQRGVARAGRIGRITDKPGRVKVTGA